MCMFIVLETDEKKKTKYVEGHDEIKQNTGKKRSISPFFFLFRGTKKEMLETMHK